MDIGHGDSPVAIFHQLMENVRVYNSPRAIFCQLEVAGVIVSAAGTVTPKRLAEMSTLYPPVFSLLFVVGGKKIHGSFHLFPEGLAERSSVLFFFTCCKLTKIFSLMSFCFLVYNELRKRSAV
jgi:hypothetical protein